MIRIEDGFIRSAGLGSDLWPPGSIVVDRLGLHYDPSHPSELEQVLEKTEFTPEILDRARNLKEMLLNLQITKYNVGSVGRYNLSTKNPVLVPGQVEDDLSVKLGGGDVSDNLEFLKRVRNLEPDAYIIYKPHPDVERGHRRGAVEDREILEYADEIVRDVSMHALLNVVDTVHVLTSLSGFEALLRGRRVVVHGQPFYSSWGLTEDLRPLPRRRRRLRLDELVAGALILYPRYIDPISGVPCSPEVFISKLASSPADQFSFLPWVRKWQGKAALLMNRRRREG